MSSWPPGTPNRAEWWGLFSLLLLLLKGFLWLWGHQQSGAGSPRGCEAGRPGGGPIPGHLLAGARLRAKLSGSEGVRAARMDPGPPILGSVHRNMCHPLPEVLHPYKHPFGVPELRLVPAVTKELSVC